MATTNLIIEHDFWKSALKAAKVVAGRDEPYDVVQLHLDPDTEEFKLTATNPKATLVINFDAEFVNFITERDETVEFAKRDLDALLHMKFAKVDNDEDILVGINITDQAITITDESGFGLGLNTSHATTIPRNPELAPLGDPVRAIRNAANDLRNNTTTRLTPYPEQTDTINKVQASFKRRATLNQINTNPAAAADATSKILAIAPGWSLTTTAYEQPAEQTPPTDDDEAPAPLSFEDGERPGLRIVRANPNTRIS